MPLVAEEFKQRVQAKLTTAFAREFKDEVSKDPGAAAGHKKLCAAISDVALAIVEELTMNAQVAPGIPVATAGSPAAQAGSTTAPGKIL